MVGDSGHVYAFLPTEQLAHCSAREVAGTRLLEHDPAYANAHRIDPVANRDDQPAGASLARGSSDNLFGTKAALSQLLMLYSIDRAHFKRLCQPRGRQGSAAADRPRQIVAARH